MAAKKRVKRSTQKVTTLEASCAGVTLTAHLTPEKRFTGARLIRNKASHGDRLDRVLMDAVRAEGGSYSLRGEHYTAIFPTANMYGSVPYKDGVKFVQRVMRRVAACPRSKSR